MTAQLSLGCRLPKNCFHRCLKPPADRWKKGDFFLIAENMKENEIHPEVVRVLDAIAELLPQDTELKRELGVKTGAELV